MKRSISVDEAKELDSLSKFSKEWLHEQCASIMFLSALNVLNMNISNRRKLQALGESDLLDETAQQTIGLEIAERVLPICESLDPEDTRLREAIEAKRSWMIGKPDTFHLSKREDDAKAVAMNWKSLSVRKCDAVPEEKRTILLPIDGHYRVIDGSGRVKSKYYRKNIMECAAEQAASAIHDTVGTKSCLETTSMHAAYAAGERTKAESKVPDLVGEAVRKIWAKEMKNVPLAIESTESFVAELMDVTERFIGYIVRKAEEDSHIERIREVVSEGAYQVA